MVGFLTNSTHVIFGLQIGAWLERKEVIFDGLKSIF